jgi:NAD(P) transhydrogenase subunit alpha
MAQDSSTLYARNVEALISLLLKDGALHVDLEDEVIAGSLLTHDGKIVNERAAALVQGSSS